MKRAAVYIRMSTDKQEDSPERQRMSILPYCQRKDYTVVGRYEDLGQKGWDNERPDFVRLLADAQRGLFDVIVVDEWSRLSRANHYDCMKVVILPLRECGVKVDCVAEGLLSWDDASDVVSPIMSILHANKSSQESVNLAKRTTGGMLKRAKQGSMHMGRPPYGYRYRKDADGNRVGLEVDSDRPERAEVVRRIFTSYLDRDLSTAAIARELNRDDVPPPSEEGMWTKPTVLSILTNEKYGGTYTFGVVGQGKFYRSDVDEVKPTPRGTTGNVKRARGEYTSIPCSHPAIIPPETFELVRKRLEANRLRTGPSRAKDVYPLSGLMVCVNCGCKMHARLRPNSGRDEAVYRCAGSNDGNCPARTVSEKRMLGLIGQVLRDTLLAPANRERLLEEMRRQSEDKSGEAAKGDLEKRIARLEGQIAKLSKRLLVIDDEDVPAAKAQLRDWRSQLAAAKAELDTLSRATEGASPKDFVMRIENLVFALQSADPELVRRVIRESVNKVDLAFGTVHKAKKTFYPLEEGTLHLCTERSDE